MMSNLPQTRRWIWEETTQSERQVKSITKEIIFFFIGSLDVPVKPDMRTYECERQEIRTQQVDPYINSDLA